MHRIGTGFIVGSLLLAALAACGAPRSGPVAPQAGDSTSKQGAVERARGAPRPEALTEMSLLATGKPLPQADVADWTQKIAKDPRAVDAFIDKLLASDGFANEVGPDLMAGQLATQVGHHVIMRSWLLRGGDKGAPLYLREACKPTEAVTVTPWWDPSKEVKVCPEAYRPERFRSPQGGFCDGNQNAPDPARPKETSWCGCGPAMMRCYPDETTFMSVRDSLANEVRATLREIIKGDRAPRDAYLSQATYRDRNAEFVLRRWEAEVREDASGLLEGLKAWPATGKWAERNERITGQHAGILTTPISVYKHTGLRGNMADMTEGLWCTGVESQSVKTETVLSLRGANIRAGEGWEQLVSAPGCTDCHARLDHAAQFFRGFGDIRTDAHFVDGLHKKGRGTVYIRNFKDKRTDGDLSPRAFAEIAVVQPEFHECIARRTVKHVLGDEQPDVVGSLAKLSSAKPFREVMRSALRMHADARLYADTPKKPSLKAPPTPPSTGPEIVLADAAASTVENVCSNCHDDWGSNKRKFDRNVVEHMLSRVAYGSMPPRGTAMASETREAFANALIDSLWTGEARESARLTFIRNGSRIHAPKYVLPIVRAGAGVSKGVEWPRFPFVEGAVPGARLTPSFATAVAAEAVVSCRTKGGTPSEIASCVAKAGDVFGVLTVDK